MKLITYLSKKADLDKDGLVLGLLMGLVWGLVMGLVWGLVFGLLMGLVWGLVFGLFGGLLMGLGVVIGVNIIAFFQSVNESNWIILLIFFIIIMELLFFSDTKKPKKRENRLKFTAKRKRIAGLWTALIITQIGGGTKTLQEVVKVLELNWDTAALWLGYIGIGVIGLLLTIGIVYLYLLANSLKYEGRK